MKESLLQSHIELIYDSVTDDQGWAALIETLVSDLDCRSGHVSLEALDQSCLKQRYSSGIAEEDNQLIVDYYHQHDVWTKALVKQSIGRFYLSEQLVPQSSLRKTEFFNDFCKPTDLGYITGAIIGWDGDVGLRIGFQHTHRQGSLADKLDHLNMLVPHLCRAAKLRQNLIQHHCLLANTSALLSKMPVAIALVNAQGQILLMNAHLEQLVRGSAFVKIKNNTFVLRDGNQGQFEAGILQAVRAAEGRASGQFSSLITVRDANGAACLEVGIEPFSSFDQQLGMQYRKAVAMIIFNDVTTTERVNVSLLVQMFGLTRREIYLANELLQGKSLEQIAGESNRTLNTLRSQLRSLFIKTETNSQAQLIARLMSSIATKISQ